MKIFDWLFSFGGLFSIFSSLFGGDSGPKRTIRPHTKDYSKGPGLFGKHHGTFKWGGE